MCAALVHRGPDAEGIWSDHESGVAIGARRLSVIDVAGGDQPMENEDGMVHAVFNGEIYNFRYLREHLADRGHTLRTECDTEVLVHLYEEYGDACVHALEGMFAFAIWDSRRRRLFCARDRFGEKPFFYAERNGVLTIASELTALLTGAGIPRDIRPEAVDDFFVFGYVPGPETIVRGVRQLPPGHTLVWEDARLALDRYWEPPAYNAERGEPASVLANEVGELLERSVRSRLIADVPLGVFLSGGVDSTLVAAFAARNSSRPIKTFTIGYDVGEFNETDVARTTAAALGAEHHELILSGTDVATRAPKVLAALDQPLADQALIALHALAEFARSEVTVAVGGEGADELFGGYPRYRYLTMASRTSGWLPEQVRSASYVLRRPTSASSRMRRFGNAVLSTSDAERHVDWVTAGRRYVRAQIYGPRLRAIAETAVSPAPRDGTNGGLLAVLMRGDQMRWLPDDVLAKADRASMLASLEVRTPYLFRELAEFAAAVPPTMHVAQGGKALLRRVLREFERKNDFKRVKTAFRVPVRDWLVGPLAPLMERQLASSALYDEGWFDRDVVARLFRAHQQAERDWSEALWPLVALGCWLDPLEAA